MNDTKKRGIDLVSWGRLMEWMKKKTVPVDI